MSQKRSRFLADRRGNFSILMAFVALPLTLGAGMALDVSAIQRSKAKLQAATDAAAIAIARQGVTVSDADAYRIADELLRGNLHRDDVKFEVKRAGTSFTVQAEGPADTSFGNLFGYSAWPVKALSSADIALVPYEIALVLDTTGSMRGGKLQAMKDAVVGLVDTMSANVTVKENLKFAVVPFSSFVNVGPQFAPRFDKKGHQIPETGAQWLDLKGASEVPQSELGQGASRFQIYNNLGQDWPGCVETREPGDADLDVGDGRADPRKAETLFVPAFSIDEPDGAGFYNSYIKSDAKVKDKSNNGKKRKFAKYGVATDGAGNPLNGGILDPLLDTVVALLGGLTGGNGTSKTIKIDTSASAYNGKPKGPGNGCDAQPIMPLSNDYAALKAKVNSLVASGNTNIMEGVSWGERVLSPGEPFAESAKSKPSTRKIMIVLTDGSNVMGVLPNELGSAYTSFGFAADARLMPGLPSAGSSNQAMNERTLKACEIAKAEGMEVYTIRLEEPNRATGTMLTECATSPAHFFDVPSRSRLDEAFGKIGDKIATIRLSS